MYRTFDHHLVLDFIIVSLFIVLVIGYMYPRKGLRIDKSRGDLYIVSPTSCEKAITENTGKDNTLIGIGEIPASNPHRSLSTK